MPEEYLSKYNTFIRKLIEIGVDPRLVSFSHIIDMVSHSNNEVDFDTSNIIPGPFGELVKINYSDNQIEIYSIDNFYYSEKVVNLETGKAKQERVETSNFLDDINYYGTYLFDFIITSEEKDFSRVRRIRFNNHTKCEIKKQELTNDLIREELPKLKAKISSNLSDYYAHIGVRKIINQIDKVYNYRDTYKEFESDDLSNDMVWLINNKLRLDFLKEETEKSGSISIFPLVDLYNEYTEWDPNNKKAINNCNVVMNRVNYALNNFYKEKSEIIQSNKYLPEEEKYAKLNMKLFLRRAKEINKEEK